MTFYDKRKKYLIEKLERELTYLSNKARFIKMIIDGKLKINNISRQIIILALSVANFDEIDGSYNYLLSMPIHTLTKEKYEELLLQEAEKERELAEMKKRKPIDMYKEDLNDLKKELKKDETYR